MRQSLGEALLGELLPEEAREETERLQLRELLEANDFERLETLFRGVFAAIPHQWHMNNTVARYEAHYASVIHCCFLMHGVEPIAEDSGSRGRADMAIRAGGRVYLFEFKVVERGREGTAQLREKGYADKYRHLGRSVHLIGVEFSRAERNVVGLRDRLKPGGFGIPSEHLVEPCRIFVLKILTDPGLRLKRTRRNVTEAQPPPDGFLEYLTPKFVLFFTS